MSENKVPPPPTTDYKPGDGIRSMKSTNLFRAVNFELYAKPVRNKRPVIYI